MNKGLFVSGMLLVLGIKTQVKAANNICIFDVLGKSGKAYQAMEKWALAAKEWFSEVNLLSYQNEAQVQKDVEQGKCNGVYMNSMRARRYNKFAVSVDAVPSLAIAQ